MKKILAVMLSMGMALSLFGCQSGGTSERPAESSSKTETEEQTKKEADEAEVTIVYMRQAGNTEVEDELIKEFEAQNPGIKVQADDVPTEECYNKLALSHNAGNPPDVIMTFWSPDAAANGMLEPLLGSYVDETDYLNRFVKSCREMDTYDGNLYAVPFRAGPDSWFANKDMLDAAGLEIPKFGEEWNWDTFREYAEALRDPDAGTYGIGIVGGNTNGTEWQFWPFLFQAGGKIIENGKAVFNGPEGVEALEYVCSLIQDDLIPPGITTTDLNMLQDMQIAHTLCMWTDGPWMLSTMRNTYPEENICVLPMTTAKTFGNLSGGTSLGMSSISNHKDEAWKFIEFMTSDEVLLKWNKGTGNAPPVYSAWDDPYYAEDRDWQVMKELAMQDNEYIIPANHYPESIALNQIMRNYLQAAYIGEMSPKEALDAAAEEWNEILEKYDPGAADLIWK